MNKITIIICTYNRPELLDECLDSLMYQNDKNFEIIVVDNNSLLDIKEVANKYLNKLNIKYVREKNQGLSFARNKGIEESLTEYCGFLDDDAKVDRNFIEIANKIANTISPQIFGGPIYPFYKDVKPKWFKDEYETRMPATDNGILGNGVFLSGSNIFFKKDVFNKIGFFDTNLGMNGLEVKLGEESKLQQVAQNKKIEIYFKKDLKVFHLVPKSKMSVKYLFKRNIKSSISSYSFLNNSNIFSKNLMQSIRNSAKLVLLMIYFPFRDKRIYPYWQNYFVGKILNKLRPFVWLYLSVIKNAR